MKTDPIRPARIEWADDGQAFEGGSRKPLQPARAAADRAQALFLSGNELPTRWQGRDQFVVLEVGFGFGHKFLQTWLAWRQDPQAPQNLTYVALEARPPVATDLQQAHSGSSAVSELAAALVAAWPPLTPNIHLLEFDEGRLRLLLAWGEVDRLLPALQLKADAVSMDGLGLDGHPAGFSRRVASALARLMADGGTLVAAPVDTGFASYLKTAGFSVTHLQRSATPKQDLHVLHGTQPKSPQGPAALVARYAPTYQPKRLPQRQAIAMASGLGPQRTALIIGGGLAGTLAAQALARTGWACVVLDRNPQPAQEASGNPAGLFHGTAHTGDGLHARFSRAAALLAAQRYAALVNAGHVSGEVKGVLRLFAGGSSPELPTSYLEALSARQASAKAGCVVADPAWLYPSGGWISPVDLCLAALKTPGISWQGNSDVQRLEVMDGLWRARSADGRCIAEAPIVICATGTAPPPFAQAEELPLNTVRGQVSWTRPADSRDAATVPDIPLTGHGYALRMPDGRLLFGASSQPDDPDPNLRAENQLYNQQRLAALCGLDLLPETALRGRVGWRANMPDRLPLVGAWPLAQEQIQPGARLDHCRMVPRVPGLFVLLGLGSRGLTWGPLAAEVLVAWINGTPMPLETDLLDAIDPARTLVRRVRQNQNPRSNP